jgi:hypothetical protein
MESTATTTTPTKNGETQSPLRTCARCGNVYDWRRSASSSLKMTYCGSLCEMGDLGFTIEAILRMDIKKTPTEPLRIPVAAA